MAKRRSGTVETVETPEETAPETAPKTRVRKELGSLDISAMKVIVVTNADTMRDFKRTRGERHPEQLAVDNLVRKAYETWVQSGKATTWNESRGLLLSVPADQMDTLRTRVQRSGTFFDFAIRFSDVKEADGHAEVLLVVKDKNVQSENDTDVDDDEETEDSGDGSEETEETEESDTVEPGSDSDNYADMVAEQAHEEEFAAA